MNDLVELFTSSVAGFYLGLVMLAIPVALAAALLSKKRYDGSVRQSFLFFLTLNIVIPFAGVLMTIWLVFYLLYVQHRKRLRGTHVIDMNEFYEEFPRIQRHFGEASMPLILSSNSVSGKRKMQALISLAENAGRNEISLIRKRMADRDDEVRHYSFSVINKLERDLNEEIHRTLQRYAQEVDKPHKAKLAAEIAMLYWEMIYLELLDPELISFVIEEVNRFAKEALEEDPNNRSMMTILGRCALMTNDLDRAERFLAPLEKEGEEVRDDVIPYLAELYFRRKEFDRVKEVLGNAGRDLEENFLFAPIAEIWQPKRVQ